MGMGKGKQQGNLIFTRALRIISLRFDEIIS
jgi:hypothetical protein